MTRTSEGVQPALALDIVNDEEAEDESNVCTGDEEGRRKCTEDGGGIQDAAQAVHREAETKDGGRKRWRRQLGRSGEHGR